MEINNSRMMIRNRRTGLESLWQIAALGVLLWMIYGYAEFARATSTGSAEYRYSPGS
jgi:hypothetical protein